MWVSKLASIEQIAQRVRELSRRPGAIEIFGAEDDRFGHKFQRNLVSPESLASLEATLGVKLSSEYRDVLMKIGPKVGPYYGMYRPDEILKEIDENIRFLEDGMTVPDPAKAFPVQTKDLKDLLRRVAEGSDKAYIEGTWPADGCVPICFQGCQFWSTLVTAGEFIGTVWDVAWYENHDGQWTPARRPPGILSLKPHVELPQLPMPPTLFQWYEGWLERVEADIANYKPPSIIGTIRNWLRL